jgi:hypothetical protein
MRGGRTNGEGEGWGIWLRYFIYLYENRIMKPIESILSRGKVVRENNRGNTYN